MRFPSSLDLTALIDTRLVLRSLLNSYKWNTSSLSQSSLFSALISPPTTHISPTLDTVGHYQPLSTEYYQQIPHQTLLYLLEHATGEVSDTNEYRGFQEEISSEKMEALCIYVAEEIARLSDPALKVHGSLYQSLVESAYRHPRNPLFVKVMTKLMEILQSHVSSVIPFLQTTMIDQERYVKTGDRLCAC